MKPSLPAGEVKTKTPGKFQILTISHSTFMNIQEQSKNVYFGDSKKKQHGVLFFHLYFFPSYYSRNAYTIPIISFFIRGIWNQISRQTSLTFCLQQRYLIIWVKTTVQLHGKFKKFQTLLKHSTFNKNSVYLS